MSERIEDILQREGMYACTVKGVSMLPMMRERRDTVVIVPKKSRAKKYDVVLYRRGEDYVFHRVIKVLPDGYVIRGDNCRNKEYGIKDSDIIGILSEFHRGEKKLKLDSLSHKLYCRYAVMLHGVRMLAGRGAGFIRRKLAKK